MANGKNEKLPEPSWREQLYAYGFTDIDIDEVSEVPLHRFLIKMNLTFSSALKSEIKDLLISTIREENNKFHDKMIADVKEVIEQELYPIRQDIKALNSKVKIMQESYEVLHEKITRIDERTKEWKLIILAVILFVSIIFTVWVLHKFIWSSVLLSLFN